MFGGVTEIATPRGWERVYALGGPVYGWCMADGPPKEIDVKVTRRIKPLLFLEARSGARVETTEDHDLRIDSQMTGPQVMSHGEIHKRMASSSSYGRKSIYSFTEAIPPEKEDLLPSRYRNSAARKLAAALPYLSTVNPHTMLLKLPRNISTFIERTMLVKLFTDIGLRARMDGQIDRPFLRVELEGGTQVGCPDILLAEYATRVMRDVFSILFVPQGRRRGLVVGGVGAGLSGAQRGWWHVMSAHLGIRAVDKEEGMVVLRHRLHSLRSPEEVDSRNRVCYAVDCPGLPMLLTRIGGSAPVLVPVR